MMNDLDPLLNVAPEKITTVHLMGICGTGMAALAGMLQQSGLLVRGSDSQVYPPMSDFLQSLNIPICNDYASANLNPRPDLVIVGNVITKINPEAQALAELKIPYLSLPQALSHFFIRGKTSLVVAGTHGKTTTCSMLAASLYNAGLDPSFMIGGIVRQFGANFRVGNGRYFVSEGDEYDTAFFDKGSKFLHYRPQIAIITSLEFDHADIFPNLQAIKDSFRKFVSLLPKDGLLVAHLDDPNVREIVEEAPCVVEGYGIFPGSTWSMGDYQTSGSITRFSIMKDGQLLTEIPLSLSGRHNCLNALAVFAVLQHLGLATGTINTGLSKFSGVKRRQEIRGIEKGITVIDDFAHHPTAVRETLNGLKLAFPDSRLIAVFEPRTNSSRRSVFQKDYVQAFDAADLVLLREPLPLANIPAESMFSSRQLATDLQQEKRIPALALADTDAILKKLAEILVPKDVVAILSNGGFDNIHARLLEQLKNSK
jgi:UDP-N-acetylmuramate: L-alanyl-gamma-D-glutamyl-meso-diaminopimelate ligase